MENERMEMSEPTLLGAVWRYRWLSLAILAVVVAVGLLYGMTRPVRYLASASLVVEDPNASTLFERLGGVSPQRYVADQVAVLRSTAVAERAAEIAQQEDSSADLTAEVFLADAEISGANDSNLIVIEFPAANPEVAETGANAIAQAYQDVRRTEALRNSASALEQLDSKIASLNRDLLDVQTQIDAMRSAESGGFGLDAQLETAVERFSELIAQQNEGTLDDAARTELDDLVRQFQTMQVISAVDSQRSGMAALLREQAAEIDRRSNLESRRDQIEVDAELSSSGVALFSAARGAVETGRDASRSVAVALVLGALAAVGIPYSLSLRHGGFEGRFEPGALLGAPLLAEIPDFGVEGLKTPLPVRDAPRSAAAEGFRFGITGIELRMTSPAHEGIGEPSRQQPLRSLAIVSATVGDGKTTLAANLALAAARRGSRVLVIDADFGDQQLEALLSSEPAHHSGITDIVERRVHLPSAVETIVISDGVRLDLLGRGSVDINAPEFFRSSATAVFFEAIRGEYELVIIDTPPLTQVAYASIIARYAERALVVVPHGGDPRSAADVRDRLELVGTSIAGYIYNKAPLRREMSESEGSMKDVLGSERTQRPT